MNSYECRSLFPFPSLTNSTSRSLTMDHGGGGGHHSMPMPGSRSGSMPCTVKFLIIFPILLNPHHFNSKLILHPHTILTQMNMSFNSNPIGICLVFPSLQIKSTSQLVPYLLLIVGVSILCEYCRLYGQSFDRQLKSQLRGGGFSNNQTNQNIAGGGGVNVNQGTTPRLGGSVGLGLNTPGGRNVGMSSRGGDVLIGGMGSEESTLIGRGGARFFGT